MPLKAIDTIAIPASVGSSFDHGAFDPKTRRIFVAHTGRDCVEVIDHDSRRHIATLPGFPEVAGIVADDGIVLATNRGAATLAWIDASRLETRAVHKTGPRPNGVAVVPQQRLAIAASIGNESHGPTLHALSLNGGRSHVLELPGRPRWCVTDATASRVFVAIREPSMLLVARLPDLEDVQHWNLPASGAHGVDIDHKRGRIFVACDDATLVEVDTRLGGCDPSVVHRRRAGRDVPQSSDRSCARSHWPAGARAIDRPSYQCHHAIHDRSRSSHDRPGGAGLPLCVFTLAWRSSCFGGCVAIFPPLANVSGHKCDRGLRRRCAASIGLTQTGAVMIALDKMTLGAPPNEFEFARTGQGGPGQWVVVADTTAVSGRAIEQTSADRTDYRFPLAIYKPLSARNADVALRFKPVAGRIDQAGGIAVRLRDADNYYVVRANALEDNVRFYRVVKGKREQLEGADTKVTANEWHTLGLRAEGERFTITI